MPTRANHDKEAKAMKKKDALARARQWKDDRAAAKSPATTAKETGAQAPKEPEPKRTQSKAAQGTASGVSKSPAAKTKATQAATAETPVTAQYRKTPSREARARARANAREWSSQRKKQKVAGSTAVPSVIEVNDANVVEDATDAGDEFKTACPSPPRAVGGAPVVPKHVAQELNFIKNDMKVREAICYAVLVPSHPPQIRAQKQYYCRLLLPFAPMWRKNAYDRMEALTQNFQSKMNDAMECD